MDTVENSTFLIPHHEDHEAFGRGGGLSLFIKGPGSNINFVIENCIFEGNEALWGGGLFVEFHDSANSNNIAVNGSHFISNECTYTINSGTAGGGMRIGLYVYGLNDTIPVSSQRNKIIVENCNFTENSALHGGGVSISPALQITPLEKVALVQILRCGFERNIAKVGSAIDIDRFGNFLQGSMMDVVLESCSIRENTVNYIYHIGKVDVPHQLGIGAVHINEVPVWFRGNFTFEDNVGSAISVIGSVVSFNSCRAFFSRNKGDKGAAIALLGAAYIQVSYGTWLWFDHNIATVEGGAIYNTYLGRENLKSDSNCFIRHSNPFLHPDQWNVTFFFVYNYDQAGNNINAIHSTSILPCSVDGDGIENGPSRIFCWKGWYYTEHPLHCKADVTSDIGNLTYKDNNNNIGVYSGWPFVLPITLEDDLNNEITGQSFTITYNDTMNVAINNMEAVTVNGEPNTAIELQLESLGSRIWQFDLLVELKDCPPGFAPSNATNASDIQCVCSGSYGGAILCDDTSKRIQILNGMWFGRLNDQTDDNYYVMDCPLRFCRNTLSKRYIDVLYNKSVQEVDFDELICGSTNRTGINCAECIPGFGPAINSLTYECINCTDINLAANIVIYIASVYLPLAILFTILIIFDIRLTTGPANAFILYCQLVTSTFNLNADGGLVETLSNAYQIPFAIFNLRFIENYIPSLCFTSNPRFTTLSIFLLQYAVALFPLFMIIIVVICLKISERCCMNNRFLSVKSRRRLLSISRLASVLSRKNRQKKISDALLPAFASFLLLSYMKFSTTSSYILNDQHPITSHGNQLSASRVYYASQYRVTDKEYLVYYIPAVVVLVTFVTFTPLVLLDYPLKALEWCILKVGCLKRFYPIDKVHLFLNMFQGCYRDKMRFFAGLYFFFRFVINISYIVTDTWLQQFVVQQIATTAMIALLALCQPYEWKLLNYVDILIFTNLALLNSVSIYLYSFTKLNPNLPPSRVAIVFQYFLVFLPVIYMVSYIIWNVTRKHHEKIKNAYIKLKKILMKKIRYNGYQSLSDDESSDVVSQSNPTIYGKAPRMIIDKKKEFENDFEALLSRAEDQNTYMPSLSRSVTVVEVSGHHTEGEANVFQTNTSEDTELQSQASSSEQRPSNSPARSDSGFGGVQRNNVTGNIFMYPNSSTSIN